MRRRLLVAVLVVLLAGPAAGASGGTSSARLTWHAGPYHSFRILLPLNWRVRSASIGDHITLYYWEPGNALRKLTVVLSGCAGCVSKNLDGHTPNPFGEMPSWATSTYRISPWKLAFSGYSDDDPYPANGLVVVLGQSGRIVGSDIATVWLPQSEHHLATTILNSLQVKA